MTVLLIDLGNTALKWATAETVDDPRTYVHGGHDVLPEELIQEWLRFKPCQVVGCMVSSETLALTLTRFFNQYGIHWEWLRSEKVFNGSFKLVNTYEDYQQLGSDRWHAAIGATSLFPGEALLVSQMGTATTLDTVLPIKDGSEFFGGRILAGPAMMIDSLTQNTRCRLNGIGVKKDFPLNTADAITTGIVEAHLGMIDRAMRAVKKKGFSPRLLLAGGAAPLLSPYIKDEYPQAILKHNLVLHGLAQRAKIERK